MQPSLPDPADPADPAGVDSTLLVTYGVTLTLGGAALVTMARRRPQGAE